MTLPTPIGWARLGRVALGGALVASCATRAPYGVPVLGTALRWTPLRYGLWALGVLTIVAAVVEWLRKAPPVATAPEAAPRGPGSDLLAVGLLAAGGIAAQVAWQHIGSPDRVLSGFDYNVYVLNALAVSTDDWTLFNPDKHVFHARLVSWLAGDGDLRETMVDISVVSIGLFPALTYVLGRLAGGRFGAWLAAIVAFSVPLPWLFTAQTTAYAFFYAVVVGAAAALVWAIQRPSVVSVVIAATVAGVAASTQEKAVVVLGPVLALAVLLSVPAQRGPWRPALLRTVGLGALAVALFLGVQHLTEPPRPYTTFVSLITNQREELHREQPYTWSAVKTPDVNDPAGLRAWLPESLWDGPIEAWVAAARTPPDSNSLRLDRDPTPGRNPWVVAPNTSIAPTSVRFAVSLSRSQEIRGPLPHAALVLFGLGAASLLLFGRGRDRVAFALFGAVGSGVAPLTLKFYEHYFPHLVPIGAALAVAGGDQLVRVLLPGRWVWGGRALLAGLALAFALAQWTGDADAWRAPSLRFPPPAVSIREDPGGYAGNLQAVAAWLATQDHADKIVDCVPGSMRMVAPRDPRFTEVGEWRCLEGLASAKPGQWLVASGHQEYRSPQTPEPNALVSTGRWRMVYGWDAQAGAITHRPWRLPTSAVVVLEATGG